MRTRNSASAFSTRMWRIPFFFFNDTATTEIYTLSLHDALPICDADGPAGRAGQRQLPDDLLADLQGRQRRQQRSEEHTSELQSPCNLVCRLLLEKNKSIIYMSVIVICSGAVFHISAFLVILNSL